MNGDLIIKIATAIAIVAGVYTSYRLNKQASHESELVRSRRMIGDLQSDVLALKAYVFSLRSTLADKGIQVIEPPRLRSEDTLPSSPGER